MDSDAELVHAARMGDKAAFGVLIECYTPLVRHAIGRMIRDPELLHDLAQETFLQAYLSLDALRDETRFKSWLYGIALNMCRAYVRQRRITCYSLEDIYGGLYREPAIYGPSAEEIAERLERRRAILNAVEHLSAANREAVRLFYLDGFSVEEAAGVLGITPNAFKVRLHKARRVLKTALIPIFGSSNESQKGVSSMIPVKVVDVIEHKSEGDQPTPHYQIVLLDDANSAVRRALIIWVGPAEALAIAGKLNNHVSPRPLTQTFVARMVEAAGAKVDSVVVSALKDEVFYATVNVRVGEQVQTIDARPSDAIALALQLEAPIFVAEEVLEGHGMVLPSDATPTRVGLTEIEATIKAQEAAAKKLFEQVRSKPTAEQKRDHTAEQRETLAKAFGVTL